MNALSRLYEHIAVRQLNQNLYPLMSGLTNKVYSEESVSLERFAFAL